MKIFLPLFFSALVASAQIVQPGAGGGGGTGTATSVGLSMPATFCGVTNSPVTTSGTLTCTYATGQTANRVFGSDASGNVGSMALTAAMLPAVSLTTGISGILPTANGGTGSATVTGSGNGVLATSPTLVTPVIGVATATSINGTTIPASGTLTQTIASGTAALGTSAIASGACATVVTTTATGVAATDTIQADFNADPTAITGYVPGTGGILTVIKYPTVNNVNFKVCNITSASVSPGAVTLNWRVVR
jgi:hypothetical protein